MPQKTISKSQLIFISQSLLSVLGITFVGMERHNFRESLSNRVDIRYSGTYHCRTDTHNGFWEDRYTLNDMLKTILDKSPRRIFTSRDIYYNRH